MSGGPASDATPAHPAWCACDGAADFDGTQHVSEVHRWRPVYEHEAEIGDVLSQVVYPDGEAETPVAIVSFGNEAHPGEVAMAAEDLAVLADRLMSLRAALVAELGEPDSREAGPSESS